jgi:hypothetical protein
LVLSKEPLVAKKGRYYATKVFICAFTKSKLGLFIV